MPDANRIAAAIDLRVRQLEAQGITDAALIDYMFGHLPALQRIYDTLSDRALLGLARRYPGFARFARLMEDFSEHNRAMTAAGTHPYPDLPALQGPLKDSLERLLRAGVELEREFQAAVDARRPDQAERLNTMRWRWATDLEKLVESLHASNLPLHTQAVVQQAIMTMAQRVVHHLFCKLA
jgi:hypothetical protein